jgi:hypothetical protein
MLDQFTAAARAARNTRAADDVARKLWAAHSEGHLSELEAHAVSEALQARRAAFSSRRPNICQPKTGVADKPQAEPCRRRSPRISR